MTAVIVGFLNQFARRSVVSFAAVFRLVTQRSSPQTLIGERHVVRKKAAVCGEERCVTSLKTAAKETRRSVEGKDLMRFR